jgi:hypothetical protein
MNNTASLSQLLNRSIMLALGERRKIFDQEKRKAISEMLSRGLGPGSGAFVGKIGELCFEEIPIRTNIIVQTIGRVILESGIQPFHGLSVMLKQQAVKYIPEDFREFKSIINSLRNTMIGSDYFAPEFLSARINALNKINNEIDLLILRLYSSSEKKSVPIQKQTIYNINSQGGIVQTGNESKAVSISITSINKKEIIKSLDLISKSIKMAHDIEANIKDETKEVIEELKLEIEKQKPNGMKVSSLLFGLATAIQTIASIKPFYDALKAAILPLGIHLP